jgi:hypothetical protein
MQSEMNTKAEIIALLESRTQVSLRHSAWSSQPFPLVCLYPVAVSWGKATRNELSSKFDFR